MKTPLHDHHNILAARNLIESASRGHELGEEVAANTPGRMVKALHQLLDGYDTDPASLATVFDAPSDDMVIVRAVPFTSMCEHHVLPFRGFVSVAYVPNGKIIGLSKIPRIIRALSRRLQVQERMTHEIASTLSELVGAPSVMVVATGVHSCAELRGVETRAEMVTSDCRGVFRDDPAVRAEALALFKEG